MHNTLNPIDSSLQMFQQTGTYFMIHLVDDVNGSE